MQEFGDSGAEAPSTEREERGDSPLNYGACRLLDVAYAQVIGGTVVTMEQPARAGTKVKIPDVCEAIGVPRITTYEMLRNLGVRLRF